MVSLSFSPEPLAHLLHGHGFPFLSVFLFQQIIMVIIDETFRQGDHQLPRLDTLSVRPAFFKFLLITFGKLLPECPVRLRRINLIQMLLLDVA